MAKRILFLAIILSLFMACKKGCPDCTNAKKKYCEQVKAPGANCNGVGLTQYIDELIRTCGQDDANAYILQSATDCKNGVLTCPECN